MSRRVVTSLVLLLALGVSGVSGAADARADHHVYPARLLVYAQEWSLSPSRATLPAGRVVVQLWNRGEDAHDTRVRRLNSQGVMVGPVLAGVSVTPSGAIHTAVWHLKPGKYEIYCSLPGHLMMGMHAKLSVVG